MKLRKIRSNMTELTLNSGVCILFSYETPVAGWDSVGPFRTEYGYSLATTRHINQYFARPLGAPIESRYVSQDYINTIAK